ncbi:MAG: tetratricopeptide repeat protein [Candidatus Eisenbacteria bacterium]|nr:tetratricopeptide repeat protein [Candidatus Eisenbacteria bacterium]
MPAADRRRVRLMGLLLALAAVLPFAHTAGFDFTWDDHTIIREHPATSPRAPLVRSLTSSYWPPAEEAGLYRPLPLFVYRVGRALWNDDPAGFHLLNVVLHMLATLILFVLLRRFVWKGARGAPFAVALLFAVHPLHTEAVAGVVGSAELWAAVFGLAAYLLWLRASRRGGAGATLAAWGVWVLALASKEHVAGWLAVMALHRIEILPGRGAGFARRKMLDIGMLAAAAAYVMVRNEVLGDLTGIGTPPKIENPLVVLPALERIPAAGGLWLRGFSRLFWPFGLRPDASFAQTRPEVTGGDAAATLFLAGMTLLALLRGRRGDLWAWGWLVGVSTQLLTLNILFPIGTCYAERFFYTPSAGYLWAAVALATRLPLPRNRTAAVAAAVVAAAGLGGLTYRQASIWKNDRTLFAYAVAAAPRSAKAHLNHAVQLWHAGEKDACAQELAEALALLPGYPEAVTLQARLLSERGHRDAAQERLREMLASHPSSVEGWVLLGGLLLQAGEEREALAAYRRAAALAPEAVDPQMGIASALAAQEQWNEAVLWWEKARRSDPDATRLLYPYGVALWRAGRADDALAIWREARARGVTDARMLNDMAWVWLQSGGAPGRAEQLARQAVALDSSANHLDTLLQILLAAGRPAAADSVLARAESLGVTPDTLRIWRRMIDAREDR